MNTIDEVPIPSPFAKFVTAKTPHFWSLEYTSLANLGITPTSQLLEQDLPEPSWVVDRMIPEGELTFLISDGGVGKSWLLLYLARTLTTGITVFLDHACTPCPVVYVDMELDKLWYTNRVRKIDAGLRQSGLASNHQGDELYYAASPNIMLDEAPDFLKRLPDSAESGQPLAFDYLHALIQATEARVLILDPIAELWGDVDENSASETAAVCRGLRAVARSTNAAIIVAHHTNKGRIEERGSTAIRNAAAAMFTLNWHDRGKARIRKLEANKARHSPELVTMFLDYEFRDNSFFIRQLTPGELGAHEQAVSEESKRQHVQVVLEIVSASPPKHYKHTDLIAEIRNKGLSKRDAEAAVAKAEADGVVVTDTGPRGAKLYKIPDEVADALR